MTIELNRRTFIALIGASSAAVAIGRPARLITRPTAPFTGTPRCFMADSNFQLPAQPKTAAITYL